jgi:hypothetical protein
MKYAENRKRIADTINRINFAYITEETISETLFGLLRCSEILAVAEIMNPNSTMSWYINAYAIEKPTRPKPSIVRTRDRYGYKRRPIR